MTNERKPKGRKLYEQIVDELIGRIHEGSLRPGDRLPPERVLASDLGVSRTAIREALRSMEMMGCVQSRVGEGTFIKSPSMSDIVDPFSLTLAHDQRLNNDLIEARLILETEIAALASARRTEAQLAELDEVMQIMRVDIEAGRNGVEADDRFHAILARASGNEALNTILTMCADMLSRTRRITQSIEGVPEETLRQHQAILDAVRGRDGAKARRHMRYHLTRAQQNLRKIR